MVQYPIGTDDVSSEIIKKALVLYYRAWSYYWNQKPTGCVIHPAESFVELADEAIVFSPRGVSPNDIHRLCNAFDQRITFIAAELPERYGGYCTATRVCRDASPLLVRVLEQLNAEYADLVNSIDDKRRYERGRQEWRLSEAGTFSKHYDGKTTRLALVPERADLYTYTVIAKEGDDFYFTASKSGPKGDVIEQGFYRKHRHELGRQTCDNLDLFPSGGCPTLWRLVKAGAGFKAFHRRVPRIEGVYFGA